MYAICKTICPSNHVEHSIYCHFYSYNERNLVTAGANVLKVYRLIQDLSPKTNRNEYEYLESNELSDNVRLECLHTFTLNANVESLNSVSFVGASRDCLLLAFADAKLSIVEYDPGTHDLKTISLHYFEDNDMKLGFTTNSRPPLVRVDPENRCAAMLTYGKSLVIIPFRKDIVVEESDSLFLSAATSANATGSKKMPVLPSYKLNLDCEQYGVNIINIIDIQFLYNYYEPTLMILYEPVKTWPGRVAMRQDTVSMITLSLDVHQRVHPHIWSLNNLPFNTFGAMPVPKPIGGVLILANNALIHLNQGLPPYGISLNCFNEGNTSFPLKKQDSVLLSLDCSQSCFVSNNTILLSLKNGELCLLKLHHDMTRSLRTFNFTIIGSSVMVTSLTKCEKGYFFLGSRLSHSLLLHFIEKTDGEKTESLSIHPKASTDSHSLEVPDFENSGKSEDEYLYGDEYSFSQKRLKVEPEFNELQDVEVSKKEGEEKSTTADHEEPSDADNETQNKLVSSNSTENFLKVYENKDLSYHLQLCDLIYNIGPCGNVCIGEPTNSFEGESNYCDIEAELVTTSGYLKNGALSIVQRTIKPQINTSFKLSGCIDAWTVYGPDYYSEKDTSLHKYLILSQEEATLVFQIGQEINELDHSGFITQSPTVFVGNLGDNRYILQVCARSVRLLDGPHQLQHFPLDVGSPIVFTSLADPYSVLMSEKGVVILLRLKIDPHTGSARLVVTKPDLSTARSRITSMCIYKDVSDLFTTKGKHCEQFQSKRAMSQRRNSTTASLGTALSQLVTVSNVDEEDELLYGKSGNFFGDTKEDDFVEEDEEACLVTIRKREPTFWLFLVRENGILEVYTLPDFKLVYLVKNFPLGLRVLVDSVQTTDHSYQDQVDSSNKPMVREILVCGMGLHATRPFLFARLDEDLYIYEVFPFFEAQVENHLKVRFKKITSSCIFLKPFNLASNTESELLPSLAKKNVWMRSFSNIAGYSGVFLCGPYPFWMLMTHRGELRLHSMEIDGPVTSFADFNNDNCPNGFLYFNASDDLRFSVLPDRLQLDSSWPIKQVPLNRTVHFINYHMESKTYALVTSRPVEVSRIVRVGGDEKDYDTIERDAHYLPAITEQFELQLLSPYNWTIIPSTTVEMEEWEHVTCLKNVMLASEGTSSGLKGYIVLGTNYSYGEDVTNRGRIWIFDIIEVVPEPGQPLTKNKFKIVYCKEQKGPVTALCQVKGYLLSAIGQKIYIWQLKESQLIGIAFIDTQIYIHTATSLRNLILVGDVYKSISLLRYQEETRTLSLVSRDHKPLQVYACEYFIDNTQMSFVVSDIDKNLIIFAYQPDTLESLGGTRLLRRADFHLGLHVNSFFRIRCRAPCEELDVRVKQSYHRRHVTMFLSLDGALGYLLPINEKTYRRLLMLQNVLTTHMQHAAGLNPKGFRMVKIRTADLHNPSKNILDGDLLFKFLNLSLTEKVEIAKKIGTSTKHVIEDLQEIHCITSHF